MPVPTSTDPNTQSSLNTLFGNSTQNNPPAPPSTANNPPDYVKGSLNPDMYVFGTTPYARGFAGASTDPNVFSSNDYIKNLNQNVYARQANQGNAPGFNQDQFNQAWNANMTGGNFNPNAFNQALGITSPTGVYGGQTGYTMTNQTDPSQTAAPYNPQFQAFQQQQQAPVTSGVNPTASQAPPQAPTTQPQQTQQNPLMQLLQSIFGIQGSAGGTANQSLATPNLMQGYNQYLQQMNQVPNAYGGQGNQGGQGQPQFQGFGNNGLGALGFGGYGMNPFGMTGVMAPSMSNFNSLYNPMSGNYGQLGGVAQLLNNVNNLRLGYGGIPGGANFGQQNPFRGFSPLMGNMVF